MVWVSVLCCCVVWWCRREKAYTINPLFGKGYVMEYILGLFVLYYLAVLFNLFDAIKASRHRR